MPDFVKQDITNQQNGQQQLHRWSDRPWSRTVHRHARVGSQRL